MVQFRICEGDAHLGDLRSLFENWFEPFDETRAPNLYPDGEHPNLLINEELRDRATWAEARSFSGNHENRCEFSLFFNHLTVRTIDLGRDGTAGSNEVLYMVPEAHTFRVRVTNDDNRVVVYLTGNSAAMSAAKTRISRRLYPERRRGGLRWLSLTGPEIQDLLHEDETDPDRRRRAGFTRGDGLIDVHLRNGPVTQSPVMNAVDQNTISSVEYASITLEGERVRVNGAYGSVSSSRVDAAALQQFVERRLLPVIRERRGGVRRLTNGNGAEGA